MTDTIAHVIFVWVCAILYGLLMCFWIKPNKLSSKLKVIFVWAVIFSLIYVVINFVRA